MRNYLFSVLSVLITGPLGGLTTPVVPRWDDMHVKHEWDAVPTKWDSLGPPPVGTTIDLSIALKPDNENALIDALNNVSNPGHPRRAPFSHPVICMYHSPVPLLRCSYGAHLTKDQVSELDAPHQDTLELVNSWLEHHGVLSSLSTTQGGSWLKLVGVPVSKANDLLDASFQLYQYTDTNDTILRTISYSLPEVLHAHVQTITPTTFFGLPRTLWQTPRVRGGGIAAAPKNAKSEDLARVRSSNDGSSDGDNSGSDHDHSGSDGDHDGSGSDGDYDEDDVAPSYVRWLYHLTGYVPKAVDKNMLGIVGYNGDYPNQEDLKEFMIEFRTDGEKATYEPLQINGGKYDTVDPGIESTVDIQYSAAIAYPTRTIFYSVGGNWDDALHSWLLYMADEEDVPQTIVTTYGIDEVKVPMDYAAKICRMFAQLGSRGVSILYSSGDDGVGEGDCMVKDSRGNDHYQFLPLFPATCTCGVFTV